MPLIPTKTQLELDQELQQSSILDVLEAAHNTAVILRAKYDKYWGLPTERLLALMNSDVPGTLEIFARNTTIGEALNNLLDAVPVLDVEGNPKYPTRAPVVTGRSDIIFDFNTGQFVVQPET